MVAMILWFVPSGGAADRVLTDYRVDQWPVNCPPAWQASLEDALHRIPKLSIQDAHAEDAALRVVDELPWVMPGTVSITRALPEGLRLAYVPRRPRAVLVRQGQHLAVLGRLGAVLPDGLQPQIIDSLIHIQAPQDYVVPAPGSVVAHSFLQSALDAMTVAYKLRNEANTPIVRIEPRPDYPSSTSNIAPPVSFVLANGKRIEWGRPQHALGPFDRSTEKRLARLKVAFARYPGLEGIRALDVSSPAMTAIDMAGRPVKFQLK